MFVHLFFFIVMFQPCYFNFFYFSFLPRLATLFCRQGSITNLNKQGTNVAQQLFSLLDSDLSGGQHYSNFEHLRQFIHTVQSCLHNYYTSFPYLISLVVSWFLFIVCLHTKNLALNSYNFPLGQLITIITVSIIVQIRNVFNFHIKLQLL